MARKFAELRAKMDPQVVAHNKERANATLLEMNLQELRTEIAALSQEDVAGLLEVTQGYVSRMERQKDMSLSRLQEYVQALGGEIEVRAKINGKEVRVTQFDNINTLEKQLVG